MRTAALVAVVAALLYSVSPLTVWATLLLGLLLWAASRDLPSGERRWFLSIAVFALGLRYAALAMLPLLAANGAHEFRTFFGDDFYNIQRSIWLHHLIAGIPIAPWDAFDAFQPIAGRTGYQYVLAFLHLLVGESPYGVLMVNVVLHAAAVVLLYRIVRRGLGADAALAGAALLWFYPTLFAWSVSALKEPMQLLLTTVALVAVIEACRAPSWPRTFAASAIAIVALLAIFPLRSGAMAILIAGLVAGLVLRIATYRSWTFAAAVGVASIALATVLTPPRLMRLMQPELQLAVKRHLGHVLTAGDSYKLFDDRVYFEFLMATSEEERQQVRTLSPGRAITFLARAATAFLIEPRPASMTSMQWLTVVPQQIAWYAAMAFAIPGIVVALRRDALLACLLFGMVVGGVAVAAPNSGNLGTLIRHRDMISPFVFVLAGAGLVACADAIGRRAMRHA